MDESEANELAVLIGGEAWQSGGGIWVVCRDMPCGAIEVVTPDAICEYEDEEGLAECRPRRTRRVGPLLAALN
jgi:hypothetical protein